MTKSNHTFKKFGMKIKKTAKSNRYNSNNNNTRCETIYG